MGKQSRIRRSSYRTKHAIVMPAPAMQHTKRSGKNASAKRAGPVMNMERGKQK